MLRTLVCVVISLQVITNTEALVQIKTNQIRYRSALRSVGSDVLQRPDDEDSPEYREYLKNLMKMQANRAKLGHSAPSSGSSDAYFAKLTRLKVEKQALRAAGLPDDMLDTGYTQDDYDSAIYESQEPLVSASVLTGEAAVATRDRKSNSKTRPMTYEERNMQEQAGRTVQAALERQEKLPQDQRAAAVAANNRIPGPRASTEPSPEVDLIDQVLAGRSLIQMKPQVMQQQTQAKYAARLASVPAPAKSAPVAAATPVAKVATPPPPPVVQKVAPAASAVPLRPLPPRQAPPPPAVRAVPPPAPVARAVPPPAAVVRAVPPPAAARPVPAPAAVAAKPVETGRELRIDELELMAKSLQLLVKHRGGGPFGAGRLQSVKDIANLEINLLDTVKMLTAADGVVASTKVPVAAPVKQAPVAVKQVPVQAPAPVPVRAAAPAPAPVPVRAPAPVPVAAPVAVAAPVQTRMQAPMEEDDSAPKTIAQGLDQFLLAPNRRSVQELAGLRDGLIQCLYMVQQELNSRPQEEESQASVEQNNAENEREALERIMRINAPAMSMQAPGLSEVRDDELTNEIPVEQEVKLALGLLLKHRGGPGFGHGRLVGKELDLMAAKLRSVSQRLVAEALNAQ